MIGLGRIIHQNIKSDSRCRKTGPPGFHRLVDKLACPTGLYVRSILMTRTCDKPRPSSEECCHYAKHCYIGQDCLVLRGTSDSCHSLSGMLRTSHDWPHTRCAQPSAPHLRILRPATCSPATLSSPKSHWKTSLGRIQNVCLAHLCVQKVHLPLRKMDF